MKVLVVGANGQVGRHLIPLVSESGEHTAIAMVRKEEQAASYAAQGIETVVADLEGTVEELAKAAKGCEAIVFTAGSGGQTGYDKTLLIDLDGAGKMIEAAEKVGIQRFLMVSALQAHNRENWSDSIRPYYAAKHYADKLLEASGLTYTIIRPGGLLNEPGTGKVLAAPNLTRGSIPREDVARTVLAALTEERTYNKAFDLISGEDSIAEALQKL
ncbi:SDR family oxidoreductase [Paenibacillus aurantius]|uniref:SDR family oxidoreductase n=1 Tax=Paenibacillus aurantius TaxID=2918900 RepID=A0AA96RFC1_9BACL|nr:SDR family oxidoreductase [Paenibacillus aurantius]WNQ11802.1 SDR family oxidoreductase [Paenibacillus aurantius]